ncbi:MAG: hypothetical protein AAFN92_19535 [Bacteroidota bacterium]
MRNLLTFLLLLLLLICTTACGPDGAFDADTVKGFVDKLQEEVLPTKEEYREMMEKQIAKMPVEEQAKAREDLAETLANWPTDAEIDAMIDSAVADMPTRAEIDEAIDEIPLSKIQDALREAADKLPEGEELNRMVEEGIEEMKGKMDSVKLELRKD